MKYSIVIPVYNAEKFVLKAIESLKDQTYQNIEVIVINDGSKDNSESIILDFKKSNPKFNLIYKKIENSGPSTARNTGIDLASGDYICFLDADDFYDIHLFEEIEKMISKDIDVLYFGFNEYNENNELEMKFTDEFKYFDNLSGIEMAKKKFLKETWINNCNAIYRLKLLNDNNIRYITGVYSGEDANLIYKCLINAKVVRCLKKEYFYHICVVESLFRSKFSEKNVTEFKAIEDTLSYIKEKNVTKDLYDYIFTLYYHTRVTIAKKIVSSVKWYQYFKFNKLVKKYIPKVKKPKVLYLNKKQKMETKLFNISRFVFFYFVKFYYLIKKH